MPEGVFGCAYVATHGVEHCPVAVIAVSVMHHIAVDIQHGYVLNWKLLFLIRSAHKLQLDVVGIRGVYEA
jgi:hypothetical protein